MHQTIALSIFSCQYLPPTSVDSPPPLYYSARVEFFSPQAGADKIAAESDLFFVFHEKNVLVGTSGENLVAPSRKELTAVLAAMKDPLFIGTLGDVSCYTSIVERDAAPDGYFFTDLRTVFFKTKECMRPALSTAVLVRDWHANTRYCGRCGAKTAPLEREWCSSCPSCGHTAYPRMSPAVIVAVLKEGKILLAHNRRFTTPIYSLIAGFVEPGESLESTVHREILEETGLAVRNLKYFSSQCWPFPDALMVGFIAEYASGTLNINEELLEAGWFDRNSMPRVPDRGPISRRIIDWYLETGGDGVLPGETAR